MIAAKSDPHALKLIALFSATEIKILIRKLRFQSSSIVIDFNENNEMISIFAKFFSESMKALFFYVCRAILLIK